ncbi:acyltransferase family protein [uncultured Amnibacterium sp.]|uniref:acyltransferase family protein n=1 Tax=uncultured Amnibacterium sp. TaxID=1631851 RepID=UPI0035C9ECD1
MAGPDQLLTDSQLGAERPHWRALDGLRGVAVILVVANHAGIIPAKLPAGGVGVTMFFVLSGFLITNLIARARRNGTWAFMRFLQIGLQGLRRPSLWLSWYLAHGT